MKIKNLSKIIVFLILFFVGVGFGIMGCLLPPTGVIDNSILILIAQIFILAASVYGFEIHFDIKQGKFDAGKAEKDNKENINLD